jgi:hypothetical protein
MFPIFRPTNQSNTYPIPQVSQDDLNDPLQEWKSHNNPEWKKRDEMEEFLKSMIRMMMLMRTGRDPGGAGIQSAPAGMGGGGGGAGVGGPGDE